MVYHTATPKRSIAASLDAALFRLVSGTLVVFTFFYSFWSAFTTTSTPPTTDRPHSCRLPPPPRLPRAQLLRRPRPELQPGVVAPDEGNPIGDHLLLKLFKNKVDYCRRHDIDIFYNNALLHPQMFSFWAKTAAVRAAMLAHPEAEWIWWVDSDAAFTDMDFLPPLPCYHRRNMVVHGWAHLLREKHTWTGINAGVFLLRNSQWALDFLDVWASMGPQSPDYAKWGQTLSSFFEDKMFPESDDQSGLIYLYLKEKWGEKIYVEDEYYFEGYWLDINVTARYTEIERNVAALRRRHAEKVSDGYARVWEEQLKEKLGLRRPFVTHFTDASPAVGTITGCIRARAALMP
ncbi:hypothetical protein SASPL_115813 [Salvia splendens]|uniref:Xyloglucan 6-xylosyltransferase n=1 Tax=Salvia splendens TaxID=180675 RepID=A0A8X8Y4G0_SALSN|nr:hypothetical protein SASPL_115813 [Salvia splendens]